jgi:hypothetical protein
MISKLSITRKIGGLKRHLKKLKETFKEFNCTKIVCHSNLHCTVRGNMKWVQCYSHELEDEEHCLLKCSHYEDTTARCEGLFTTGQFVSLKQFIRKDMALIAKYRSGQTFSRRITDLPPCVREGLQYP